MGSIVYRCPNCEGTEVRYDYGPKMLVCRKCGTPLKDFERDVTEWVLQKVLGEKAS